MLIGLLAAVGFCALSSAARPSKKSKKPVAGQATQEEIRALREIVAAQQEQIDIMRGAMQRLIDAVQGPHSPAPTIQAPGIASQARSSVTRTGEVATGTQSGWNGEHFFLQSSDGSFRLEPLGYVQLDYRSYRGSGIPPDTLAIRRGRFGFQGNLGKNYQITLLADFADRNRTLVREFAFNVNFLEALQFKFGQFKEPFSQEGLWSAVYMDFVERAPVNNLVPAYSPGFQIHGDFLRGAIQYQAGAFNGKSFLNLNDTSTPEGVFRLRFYPWRNGSNTWIKGLGFGGAFTDGLTQNGTSFVGSMPTRTFTFFKAEPVNGGVLRANGELVWVKGPASIRAEYVQTNQDRTGLGPSKTSLPGVVGKSYYVTATYLLTGEDRPENGQPVPRHAFLSKDGHGAGAWELKFRYSKLRMDDRTLRSGADQISTGVNWYPTPFVRYMIDFNVERLRNPVASPASLLPQTFLSVLHRVQFRF
jgi:phosphate-selective porin